MFTEQDVCNLQLAHDHLHLASELINQLMEAKRMDLTMQMVSFLSEAKQDADLGVAAVDRGDAAGASSLAKHAERAVTMAEKYMNWREANSSSGVDSSAAAHAMYLGTREEGEGAA